MQLLNVDCLLLYRCHACLRVVQCNLVNASINVYVAQHMFVGKEVSDVQDLLQSREAAEAARHGCLFARSYVQDTLQACANKEGWAQVYLEVVLRHCT